MDPSGYAPPPALETLLLRSSTTDTGERYCLADAAAERDDDPVGVALVGPGDDGRTMELRFLSVAPDRRGAGLGRRLLGDVCDVLRAKGVRRLVAATGQTDFERVALFQKAGFQFSHADAEHHWFELEL